MDSASATEMPPRSPPQVNTFHEPSGNLNARPAPATGRPTVSKRASSVTTAAVPPAINMRPGNLPSNTSIPTNTNNTALRISSMSSQNISTYRRVLSHSVSATSIADHDTRHYHRKRSRDMQMISQRVTTEHRGERNKHFDLVMINAFKQTEGCVAKHATKRKASPASRSSESAPVQKLG